MSKPEFHYVVSYIPGEGWRIASEMQDMFSDGTVFEAETGEWRLVAEDEDALDGELFAELRRRLG